MKAVAYVSGIPSLALGSDISRQIERITRYAEKNGITIVSQYLNWDGPFDDTDGGQAWQGALDYCRRHDVQTILIDIFERLSTDAITGILMVEKCREDGLNLVACSMNVNLTAKCPAAVQLAYHSLFTASEFFRGIAAEDEVAV
jgi:DNA invertase Pin-like site-specific DNA recombinase